MEPVRFLSAAELKAVSHPLRQRMLALLVREGELSGRGLRERLPEAPSNPYYHLKVLEEAGLIRLVREEQRRGGVEKYFVAVARTYSMDPGALVTPLGLGDSEVRTGILSVARTGAEDALESLGRALEQSAAPDGEIPFVNLCTFRLNPDTAATLRSRLEAWLEDLAAAARDASDVEDGPRADYTFYQLFFRSGAA